MNFESKTLSSLLQIAIFLGLMALLAAAIHLLPQKEPMSQAPAPYPALEGTEPIEKEAYPPPEETDGPVIPPTLYPDVIVQPEGEDVYEPTPPNPTFTPYPTPTLHPGPTETAIPSKRTAEDASGTITYLLFSQGVFDIQSISVVDEGDSLALKENEPKEINDLQPAMDYEELFSQVYSIPSPDHKKIALFGAQGYGPWLMVDQSEGKVSPINSEYSIDEIWGWYPDSIRLLALHGSRTLEILNPESGDYVQVAAKQYGSITSATSSPDGRRILYAHNDIDEDHKIWSVNQWGQDAYVIADGVGQVYGLAWSPDEKKIIFQGNGWMIMNSNGSNIQPIKAGDFYAGVYSAAQWSPDSHYIMVSSMRPNTDQVAEDSNTVREAVYLIDAENLTVSPLLPDRYIYDPSWSPDGSYIIYATFDDGVYEVRITNVQGTYEQSIAIGSNLVRHPMWLKP